MRSGSPGQPSSHRSRSEAPTGGSAGRLDDIFGAEPPSCAGDPPAPAAPTARLPRAPRRSADEQPCDERARHRRRIPGLLDHPRPALARLARSRRSHPGTVARAVRWPRRGPARSSLDHPHHQRGRDRLGRGRSPCCRLDVALSLLPILAVIFVTGLASGFERPALTAFEAQVIPLEQAVQGVSYQSSVSLTGSILGPVMGGIAVAVIGLVGTLRPHRRPARDLDGLPLRHPEEADARGRAGRVDDAEPLGRRQLRLGGRLRSSARWRSTCSPSSSAARSRCCRSSRPTSCTSARSASAILRTAPSLGALGVMLIATRRPPSRHAGRTLLISVAGFGVSMIVFGLSTTFSCRGSRCSSAA